MPTPSKAEGSPPSPRPRGPGTRACGAGHGRAGRAGLVGLSVLAVRWDQPAPSAPRLRPPAPRRATPRRRPWRRPRRPRPPRWPPRPPLRHAGDLVDARRAASSGARSAPRPRTERQPPRSRRGPHAVDPPGAPAPAGCGSLRHPRGRRRPSRRRDPRRGPRAVAAAQGRRRRAGREPRVDPAGGHPVRLGRARRRRRLPLGPPGPAGAGRPDRGAHLVLQGRVRARRSRAAPCTSSGVETADGAGNGPAPTSTARPSTRG